MVQHWMNLHRCIFLVLIANVSMCDKFPGVGDGLETIVVVYMFKTRTVM